VALLKLGHRVGALLHFCLVLQLVGAQFLNPLLQRRRSFTAVLHLLVRAQRRRQRLNLVLQRGVALFEVVDAGNFSLQFLVLLRDHFQFLQLLFQVSFGRGIYRSLPL